MSAARVGEQSAVVWNWLKRRPLSAMRWKLGVWIGPPKVLLAPKPTSSVKISRTLGAPFGASTAFGKSGTEPFAVRPILPLKPGSGRGRTSCAITGHANTATATAQRSQRKTVLMRLLIDPLPRVPVLGLAHTDAPRYFHGMVANDVAATLHARHASFGGCRS